MNTRSVLVALLFIASFCSYIFLASHANDQPEDYSRAIQTEERMEQEDTEFSLPEVMLVKHILYIGKRLTSIAR
ncbi:MAG: hypothetical protein KDC34_10185 [Saprospiraceae bacterium]|nr:hypothetical protein [Saprospiraceae bacterium]